MTVPQVITKPPSAPGPAVHEFSVLPGTPLRYRTVTGYEHSYECSSIRDGSATCFSVSSSQRLKSAAVSVAPALHLSAGGASRHLVSVLVVENSPEKQPGPG